MFDIGWSEILVIAVVAIVVVGPKDLPPMLRAAGRMVSKARKTAGEFQAQFNEALREAELDDVKDSINELRGLNPLAEIKKGLDPVAAAIARPESAPKLPPTPPPAEVTAPVAVAPVIAASEAAATETIAVPTVPVVAAALAAPPAALVDTAEPAPIKRTRKVKAKAEPAAATPSEGEGAPLSKPVRKRAAKAVPVETAAVDGVEGAAASKEASPKRPRSGRAKPKDGENSAIPADGSQQSLTLSLPVAAPPVMTIAAPAASEQGRSDGAAVLPVPMSEERNG